MEINSPLQTPSLPRGAGNQAGQVRPHKASHCAKANFVPKGWQGHIPCPRGLILTSSQHIVEEQISFPSIYNSTQFWRIHKNWFFTAFNSSPTCSNHHLFQFSQSNLGYFSACIWEHQKYQNTKQPRKALSQL